MAEQRTNEECKRYFSWMRGHHAYKDVFEPEINKQLTLQREPENAKDRFAVAVTEENGRIVGHIGAVENCVVLSEKGQPQRVVYNLREED